MSYSDDGFKRQFSVPDGAAAPEIGAAVSFLPQMVVSERGGRCRPSSLRRAHAGRARAGRDDPRRGAADAPSWLTPPQAVTARPRQRSTGGPGPPFAGEPSDLPARRRNEEATSREGRLPVEQGRQGRPGRACHPLSRSRRHAADRSGRRPIRRRRHARSSPSCSPAARPGPRRSASQATTGTRADRAGSAALLVAAATVFPRRGLSGPLERPPPRQQGGGHAR